jgi:hypothetical protein
VSHDLILSSQTPDDIAAAVEVFGQEMHAVCASMVAAAVAKHEALRGLPRPNSTRSDGNQAE